MLPGYLKVLFAVPSVFLVASDSRIEVPPHTICYPYWAELQNGHANETLMMKGAVKLYPESERCGSKNVSAPKSDMFHNPDGSVEVSGTNETICEVPYTNESISACLWNGGIDEDPLATKPGWLESADQRNCGKRLRVTKIRPTQTPGDYAYPVIVDGCTMHIPASRPQEGCKELWLTRGGFEAIGATKEEMDSGKLSLEWTFFDPPS